MRSAFIGVRGFHEVVSSVHGPQGCVYCETAETKPAPLCHVTTPRHVTPSHPQRDRKMMSRGLVAGCSRRAMSTAAPIASRFAVIGAGRMAEAMIGGMMAGGLQPAESTHLFDTNPERLDVCVKRWSGIQTHASATSCIENADLVLVAVKPQQMQSVLKDISHAVPKSALVVSIAAGCPIDMFLEELPTRSVCRAMPNTPAVIGQGMSVWTATEGCTEAQRTQAQTLLSCFGEVLLCLAFEPVDWQMHIR